MVVFGSLLISLIVHSQANGGSNTESETALSAEVRDTDSAVIYFKDVF